MVVAGLAVFATPRPGAAHVDGPRVAAMPVGVTADADAADDRSGVHGSAPASTDAHGSPTPAAAGNRARRAAGGWFIAIGAAVLGAVRWFGTRRSAALAVALGIAFFAHEGSVHAVHHLGDDAGTAKCSVAAAAATAIAIDDGSPGWTTALAPAHEMPAIDRSLHPTTRPRGPMQVRAPPRLP